MQNEKEFVLSDESVLNGLGFRVMTDGIDTTQFERNPVMLFNHKPGAIGSWTKLRKEGGKLIGTPVFDMEDEGEGARIGGKVKRGVIRACSAGLDPMEWSLDPKHMLPGQVLPTLISSKLLEGSPCDIPQNDNSLALFKDGQYIALSKGEDIAKYFTIQPTKTEMIKLSTTATIALGLTAPPADEAQLESKIIELATRATTAEEALKKANDAAAAELVTRCENLVNLAISDKKITAADKEHYLKLAKMDYAMAELTLSKLSKPTLPGSGIQLSAETKPLTGLAAEVKGRGLRELEKKAPVLLAKILKNDTDLYNELYKAEYGEARPGTV